MDVHRHRRPQAHTQACTQARARAHAGVLAGTYSRSASPCGVPVSCRPSARASPRRDHRSPSKIRTRRIPRTHLPTDNIVGAPARVHTHAACTQTWSDLLAGTLGPFEKLRFPGRVRILPEVYLYELLHHGETKPLRQRWQRRWFVVGVVCTCMAASVKKRPAGQLQSRDPCIYRSALALPTVWHLHRIRCKRRHFRHLRGRAQTGQRKRSAREATIRRGFSPSTTGRKAEGKAED